MDNGGTITSYVHIKEKSQYRIRKEMANCSQRRCKFYNLCVQNASRYINLILTNSNSYQYLADFHETLIRVPNQNS